MGTGAVDGAVATLRVAAHGIAMPRCDQGDCAKAQSSETPWPGPCSHDSLCIASGTAPQSQEMSIRMPLERTLYALLAAALTAALAHAQSVRASWTATAPLRATATQSSPGYSNELPAGHHLQGTRTISSSGGGGFWGYGSASSTYSISNDRLVTTCQIEQSATSYAFGGRSWSPLTSGSTILTLSSSTPVSCTISVEYLVTASSGTFIGGGASVDINNDGTPDWGPSQGQRSTIVTVSGTSLIGINSGVSASSWDGSASMAHVIRIRIDPCLPALGTGSPISVGVPGIQSNGGPPILGNQAFTLTGDSFVPNGIAGLIVNIGPLLLHPGITVPGAQPACTGLVPLEGHMFFVQLASPNGLTNTNLGIPNDPLFLGLSIGAQWFAKDPSLPYSLAFGSSPALAVRIGN